MDESVRSRLGGFLLPTANAVRSTGHHPAREDIDRADQIGVLLEPTVHAREPGLHRSIVRRHMAATRAGSARVLRRHHNELAAVPRQLVLQLAAELVPALVEDGFVQAGLGPNVSSRSICRACR